MALPETERKRLLLLEQLLVERFGEAPTRERIQAPSGRRHARGCNLTEGEPVVGSTSPTLGT